MRLLARVSVAFGLLAASWVQAQAQAQALEQSGPGVRRIVITPEVAAETTRELRWTPASAEAFSVLMQKARLAALPEAVVALPQLDASLLFGEVEKVKAYLPAVEGAKEEIIKARGGQSADREEVERSIRLGRKFLEFAEKQPSEVARRAEIFRLVLFARETLEEARVIDAALDQYRLEQHAAVGTAVTWEQLRPFLLRDSRIFNTGATIFGDKWGPLKVDAAPIIPKETFQKLKDYLPIDQWQPFVSE